MSMNIKRTTLAAAVLAVCAAGISGQAAAEAYVGSSVNLSSLTIGFTNSSGQNIPASSLSYTFFVSNSATLNSVSSFDQGTCGTGLTACGTSPVLDPAPVNAPGSTLQRTSYGASGDYALFGPSATDNFSNASSAILTSEITSGVPTTAAAVSEANLLGSGSGQASTTVQSNTTLTLSLVALTQTLTLNYAASPVIETYLNTLGWLNSTGQAAISASILLTDASGATVAGGSDVPSDLNTQRNLPTVNSTTPVLYDPGLINGGFTVSGLTAGATYTLNLTMGTSLSVSQQTVPDPATPALMALGLVVMGATLRRRQIKGRRKQA